MTTTNRPYTCKWCAYPMFWRPFINGANLFECCNRRCRWSVLEHEPALLGLQPYDQVVERIVAQAVAIQEGQQPCY